MIPFELAKFSVSFSLTFISVCIMQIYSFFVAVISIHDSEDIASAHSEHLNEEHEVVELNGEVDLQVVENKSLVIEEYAVARSPLHRCLKEEVLSNVNVYIAHSGLCFSMFFYSFV